MALRVLLVENQSLTRIGLRSVLEAEADIEVAGEAEESSEGIERFKALRPDVVVLSLRLPDSCAVDEIGKYLEAGDARIIVLADHAGDAEISRSIRKGALGYVCKDVEPEDLVRAVRQVGKGKKYIPGDIAAIISDSLGLEDLTEAEQRILEMLVGGMSNKEIAFAQDVSLNTVKTHVKNIFGKLGVSDRTSATTTAIRRGLVRIDI